LFHATYFIANVWFCQHKLGGLLQSFLKERGCQEPFILRSFQDDLNNGKLWDSVIPEFYPWHDHVELIWSW